jgi:hypothetical protein
MRRARRGVILTGGSNARALAKGIVYERKRRATQLHGGMTPRMGASDLWDVSCWCGWASTGNERRALARDAARTHREEVAAGLVMPARKKTREMKQPPAATRSSARKRSPQRSNESSDPPGTPPVGARSRRSQLTYRGRTVELDGTADSWRVRCRGCDWSAEFATGEAARADATLHLRACKHTPKQSRKRKARRR